MFERRKIIRVQKASCTINQNRSTVRQCLNQHNWSMAFILILAAQCFKYYKVKIKKYKTSWTQFHWDHCLTLDPDTRPGVINYASASESPGYKRIKQILSIEMYGSLIHNDCSLFRYTTSDFNRISLLQDILSRRTIHFITLVQFWCAQEFNVGIILSFPFNKQYCATAKAR